MSWFAAERYTEIASLDSNIFCYNLQNGLFKNGFKEAIFSFNLFVELFLASVFFKSLQQSLLIVLRLVKVYLVNMLI